MRDVPASITEAWKSGDFIGSQRPMGRVTLQHTGTKLYDYSFVAKQGEAPEKPVYETPTTRVERIAKEVLTGVRDLNSVRVSVDRLATMVVGGIVGGGLNPADYNTPGTFNDAPFLVSVDTLKPRIVSIFENRKVPLDFYGTGVTAPIVGKESAGEPTGDGTINNTYASTIFGAEEQPFELPNIKSIAWNRSTESDAADCTIVFYNTKPLPLGETPTVDLDQPGYYTFNRGATEYSNRWGHQPNEWSNLLMPDNILRTYEGYGFDEGQIPERDPNLVQTGTWLIDTVDYTHDGLITVACRDMGRLLLDQIMFPPVAPPDFYPVHFARVEKTSGFIPGMTYVHEYEVENGSATPVTSVPPPPGAPSQPTTGGAPIAPVRLGMTYRNNSNVNYYPAPGTAPNPPAAATQPDVAPAGGGTYAIYGHTPVQAFDDDMHSYFLSVGNIAPTREFAFAWLEGNIPKQTVTGVMVHPVKSNYTCFISIMVAGKWLGSVPIPYNRTGTARESYTRIPYIKQFSMDQGEKGYQVNLDQPVANVERVRVTFGNLQDFGVGEFKFRAGIRTFQVLGYSQAAVAAPAPAVPATPPPSPVQLGFKDDFARADGPLGTSKTGQVWREAFWGSLNGGTVKWNIVNGFAARLHTGLPVGTTLAYGELGSRNQSVRAKCVLGGSPGTQRQWDLALRATASNAVLVRFVGGGSNQGYEVCLVQNGVVGTALYEGGLPAQPEGQFVRATLVGDKLTVYLGTAEVASHIDTKFSSTLSVGCGFASNHAWCKFDDFEATVFVVTGVFDTFTRADAPMITAAETNQQWFQGGPAYSKAVKTTWGILNKLATRRGGSNDGDMLWAWAGLGSIQQEIGVDCATNVGHAFLNNAWMLGARFKDINNHIWVRVETPVGARRVKAGTMIGGVNTEIFDLALNEADFSETRRRAKVKIQGTKLTVTVGNSVLIDDDDASRWGNPAFGSNVAFGSEKSIASFDLFEATSLAGQAGDEDSATKYSEEVYVPPHIEPGSGAKPGTYEDYTDIVKLLCAWGGFYWAPDSKEIYSDGAITDRKSPLEDPVLGREGVGRVWGDFEATGTAGPAELDVQIFDKKALMDGINYVRDIIGFIFMIDETGAAVWRLPNVYEVGNNVATFSTNPGRVTDMVEIDEKQTLIGLRVKLNSRNVRERVFIGNATANIGATAVGWNPNPTGIRRVGGWTDQHFSTSEECQIMADLITIRQLFSYRTDSITIPGYPKIQVDDQIRVFERVTSEGYIHYVKSISSNLDLETGDYSYNLETHWLGERPYEKWAFDPSTLSAETQGYLDAIRNATGGDEYYELPRGTTPAERKALNIVFDGSTLMYGVGASEGKNVPELVRKQIVSDTTTTVKKSNVASQSPLNTAQLVARASSTVDNLYNATDFNPNILVIWEGMEHIRGLNVTAQQAFDALKGYCLDRKTKGYKVVLLTLLPRGGVDGDKPEYEAKRNEVNNKIKQESNAPYKVADVASIAGLGHKGAENNAQFFQTNKINLTDAGYDLVAKTVIAVVKGLV